MSAAQLLEPILQNGIKNTNFFNGLLLTAESLRTEQSANREQHRQLGRAIGDGVAYGFAVTPLTPSLPSSTPLVQVTAGLALNRKGEAISLCSDVQVALVKSLDDTTIATDSCGRSTVFTQCSPSPSSANLTNTGLYLLTVMPAYGFQEKAPMAELGSQGVGTTCGSRYVVEGVKFRLAPIVLSGGVGSEAQKTEMATLATQTSLTSPQLYYLRNGVANLCYGSAFLPAFLQNPFPAGSSPSPFDTYGLLDDMRTAQSLTDCEVPLAILYWTTAGVQFLDMWSVRRRPARRVMGDQWPLIADGRRVAEAEAAFLQFQDQIQRMTATESNRSAIKATNYFRYLPAAGFLPVGGGSFDSGAFFTGIPTDPQQLDSAFLRLVFDQSFYLDPIDVKAPPMVRLYQVPESKDYIVFVREEKPQPALPPSPQPPAPKVSGSIRASVSILNVSAPPPQFFAQAFVSDAFNTPANSSGLGLNFVGIDPGTVGDFGLPRVFAVGPDNAIHEGILTVQNTVDRIFVRAIPTVWQFVIQPLEAGTYTVKTQSTFFQPYTKTGVVISNDTPVRLTIKLVPRRIVGGVRPGNNRVPNVTFNPDWWGSAVVVPSRFVPAPWPPPDPVDWVQVGDPPPDVLTLLQDRASEFAVGNPTAPMDPSGVQIFIDSAHTPDRVTEQPYAYAVFGDGGSYVPLVLTPKDRTLGQAVSAVKAGVPGIDRDQDQPSLAAAGISDVDVMAASWKGLVSDTLGTSADTAATMIVAARSKVDGLGQSVLMFSGVDTGVQHALSSKNVNSAADLANAKPGDLVSDAISLAQAERIVEEARNVTPKDAWSLNSPSLGLKETDVTALNAAGISTLDGFIKAVSTDSGAASIGKSLNVDTGTIKSLGSAAQNSRSTVVVKQKAAAPTTSLFGVNANNAKALASAGIDNAGKLANAKAEDIAHLFGGNTTLANTVIGTAKTFIGLT